MDIHVQHDIGDLVFTLSDLNRAVNNGQLLSNHTVVGISVTKGSIMYNLSKLDSAHTMVPDTEVYSPDGAKLKVIELVCAKVKELQFIQTSIDLKIAGFAKEKR